LNFIRKIFDTILYEYVKTKGSIILCIHRKYTELLASLRQEVWEGGKKRVCGKLKGHGESDKEEVQESRDTGEKIEHPWGRVNQLVYSPQHRSLQTFLGDFAGVDGFISCSDGRLQINSKTLHKNQSNGEVPDNFQHFNSSAEILKGGKHTDVNTQKQRSQEICESRWIS